MEAETAPELVQQGPDGGTNGVLNTVSDSATFPTEDIGALALNASGLDSAAASSSQIVVKEGGDLAGSVPEDMEYPTEETAPAAAAAAAADAVLAEETTVAAAEAVPEPEAAPAAAETVEAVSGDGEKRGSWMSGLASSMGFGADASADKSSVAAAGGEGGEAEEADEAEEEDEESVEVLEVVVEPSSSADGDGAAVATAA
ncbi:unnamed protein product, partial [Ectocarpus fasciculatus]